VPFGELSARAGIVIFLSGGYAQARHASRQMRSLRNFPCGHNGWRARV